MCLVIFPGLRVAGPFLLGCCSSLNENGSHRLIYLSAWSTVGRNFWQELGGMVLLEEVSYWGWGRAVRFQKSMSFPLGM